MDFKIKDFFLSIQDPRRGQGQRHSIENVLTIVIMAILSGYQGLRGFARFASSNKEELTEVLNLKHGVPCYYTFHTLITALDEQLIAEKFIKWMSQYYSSLSDNYIAMDGKVVKSTVVNGKTSAQNFCSVVSAFGHQSNIVYGMQSFENGKSGEAQALRELVEKLGLKDKVFTMDALHTQKKHLT